MVNSDTTGRKAAEETKRRSSGKSSQQCISAPKDDKEDSDSSSDDESDFTLAPSSSIDYILLEYVKYYPWRVLVIAKCLTSNCEKFNCSKVRVLGIRLFYLEDDQRKVICKGCERKFRITVYSRNLDVKISYDSSSKKYDVFHILGQPNTFKFRLPNDWKSAECKFSRLKQSKRIQKSVMRALTGI